MSGPYLARLVDDRKPLVRLSSFQREALRRFETKVATGEYELEPGSCVCGADEAEALWVAAKDRYGVAVNTFLCRRCAVMWTTPHLTEPSLRAFFATDHRDLYAGGASVRTRFTDEIDQGRAMLDRLSGNITGPTTVLDVGCGAGGTLVPFIEAGHLVGGCDVVDELATHGRSEGLPVSLGTSEVLREVRPAGLVISTHLARLTDAHRQIAQWRELLAADGLLYVEFPGIKDAYENYGDFGKFLQSAHVNHFTLRSLTGLMASQGFELVWGDENVHALFRRSTATPPPLDLATEARSIMAYLDNGERQLFWRRIGRIVRILPARGLERAVGERRARPLVKALHLRRS